MNKLKKNWKTFAVILTVLFGINKCTQSCNRATDIDRLSTEIIAKDSIIDSQNRQIEKLERDTVDYCNRIRMYQGFGDRQTEFIRQRNIADSLNAVNNARLIRQNRELIDKQNSNK